MSDPAFEPLSELLENARDIAARRGHAAADLEHLLAALVEHFRIEMILRELNCDAGALRRDLEAQLEPSADEQTTRPKLTAGVMEAVRAAEGEATALVSKVGVEHLLLALLERKVAQAAVLEAAGVTYEKVLPRVVEFRWPEARYGAQAKGGRGVWQRFTERARRIVFFAQEEAARMGENYVGTEHILLGLVRESDSVAARILDRIGIPLGRIRADVERQCTHGSGNLGQDMQLTPRAKRVIDLAYEEARALNNNYIGTEHILLGLIREGDGLAARVLVKLGADLERTRREVQLMQDMESPEAPGSTRSGPTPASLFERIKRLLPEDEVEKLTHESNLAALRALAERGCQPRQTSEALPLAVEIARSICEGVDHLTGIADLTADQAAALVYLARILKDTIHLNRSVHQNILPGKTLAMVFEKQSLRTRVSFEVGMFQLGGHGVYLQPADISMGKRETVADVARNLDRMVDGIMARVFAHSTIQELAEHSRVPVINGLCDREHPCQALADLLTVWEKCGALEGMKIAYVGDGNNVAHSLMLLAAKMGVKVAIASPEGYDPLPEIVELARREAGDEAVLLTRDPKEACAEADAIYTDVWTSMGQEAETEERKKIFAPYQVNADLVAVAKPDYIFLHCLPAHRGEEVSAEVMDGPNSVVFDQAENRLHAQKAVLSVLLG